MKKTKRKTKTKLICMACASDPTSYQNDEEIPRGENITKAGASKSYCYDCGEDYNIKRVASDWKPENKELSNKTINIISNWSRKIVNELVKNDNTYTYRVSFHCEPNPLNYDGVDKFSIEVHKIKYEWDDIHLGRKFISSDEIIFSLRNILRCEELVQVTQDDINKMVSK